MKKLFACFLLLCVIPTISIGENSIFVSDAAGYISIPDGFIEIQDNGNQRVFFNSDGESVIIVCEKSESPLYYSGGDLASLISYFSAILEESGTETGTEYKVSVTNRGECAAVKAVSDFSSSIIVINRYETVMVNASYKNAYSQNAYTPFTFEPIEQPLEE